MALHGVQKEENEPIRQERGVSDSIRGKDRQRNDAVLEQEVGRGTRKIRI